MAERLVKHALSAEDPPLNQLKVLSAGIAAGTGYPASSDTVAAMKKVGIDISDHTTRQVTDELLQKADIIFGMTQGHLDTVQHYLGDADHKRLFLMREFLEEHPDKEIPDPFGRGFQEYEYARDAMVEAIPSLVAYLRTKFTQAS